MKNIIDLPVAHGRASEGSCAANSVSSAAVIPFSLARSVFRSRCHHSAGMLLRVLHFGTVQRPASSSAASSSGEGHRSMTSLKDDGAEIAVAASVMAANLGQTVLKCKDNLALDVENRLGHTVQMAESDEKNEYEQEFIARVKAARIATGKKQWQVAELMGIKQDQYKHYEVGRLIPHHLIGRFCLIASVEPSWLLTGRGPKGLSPPHAVETDPAPATRPKRAKRPRAA